MIKCLIIQESMMKVTKFSVKVCDKDMCTGILGT